MKNVLLTLLVTILFVNISSAQSGWGYVNYTSYKTHAGNGSTTQYQAFPYSAAEFDNMLNTANSNTTITHTGEVPISYVYNGSVQTPHWNADYYAIKFDFWFVPQETGTYYFGINSDDASDLFIDGNVVATYYGGHGASGYQTGTKAMVAGQRYRVVVRYQEYGGGDALYFRWYKPSGSGGWGYWNNEVTNINSTPSKKANMNFDFGSTLDKTKFNIGSALSSNGWIDITNSLDSNKVANGSKATITGGGVEWSYVNPNASWLGGNSRLLIDMRKFGNTNPSDVKSVKILDVYDGPVTYTSHDPNGWAIYTVPSPLTKVTDGTSTYNQYIRNVNGWNTDYAFACDVTFGSNMTYKQQSVTMTTSNTLSTLYGNIVTVSDVYLAFKELVNGGIFGNQTGNEFTYGIQYKNADVDDNGVFNESDCFALLQHLTGKKNLVDTFNLKKTLKLIPQSTYNTIGKSNWSTFPTYLNDTYSFDINTGKPIDTFYISGTWKGDVNLSHSAIPLSNGITTNSNNIGSTIKSMSVVTNSINDVEADIMMEKVGDSVIATINLNPNGNQIGATQFDVYFDNSILEFSRVEFNNTQSTNFDKNNGSYISLGSLNTSGGSISNIGYKIIFKPKAIITNILGLISIKNVETLNTNSIKLNVKVI